MALDSNLNSASFNCYLSRAAADTYFTNRLHTDTWTDAENSEKEAALVWASKLIDTNFIWTGAKKEVLQPMAFPRYGLYDAEGYYLSSDSIPQQVKDAVCELAILLLREDRTAFGEPSSAGLSSLSVGPIDMVFDSKDKKLTVPKNVTSLLTGLYKSTRQGSSFVDVVRT